MAATIQTDLFVYQNGDTVTVTGDGFGVTETVDIVTTDPAAAVVDQGTATTDGSGNFNYQFTLNAAIGGLYTVNATGETSGLSASTQFDPPNLSVSPTSFNFGSIGVGLSSSSHMFTVTNSGSNGNNVAVSSSDGNFAVSPTSFDVAGGGTATFTVTFSPQTFGSKSATISITPNSGTGASASVSGTTPTARSTQTTVSCSPLSVLIGSASNCTATVMDNNSGMKTTPTGDVAWSIAPAGGSFDSSTCTLTTVNSNSASCSGHYTPTSPAGNRTITATYSNHGDHSGSAGSTTLAVTTSSTSLSVAAAAGNYGGTVNLSATLTASGSPVGGKTVSFNLNGTSVGSATTNASGVATLSNASLGAISVGSYSMGIAAGFGGDSSFLASSGSANLTVNKAVLTVTADPKTKTFGTANPPLSASFSGFQNGQTLATSGVTGSPSLSTLATSTSSVGNYTITVGLGTLAATNYSFAFVNGTLGVTTATLTITADSKTKAYGAPLPSFTVSYSGFVAGDTAASLTTQPTVSTTATALSHVGSYAITASGAVDSNYTINYVGGTLSVTPVPLTITADSKSMVYGAALPTLTVSYTGFVNNDTAASLTPQPTITTSATTASHVSGNPYSITGSGAVDPDYTISYIAGTLTVTAAALTITAVDKSKAYSAALPVLTVTYAGFVNSDTAASLTTPPSVSTTATAASHVAGGPYAITASGAVDTDYSISYVAGSLTVTPVPLKITADDKTKGYGAALPALTVSYAGLVNGDSAASLTVQPTVTTSATANSGVGTYPTTASGAIDSDYTITYAAGTLSVTVATLTITADDQTKVYGAALPALTVSYAGFVNDDTVASLTTQPTVTTVATSLSHLGTYAITASGAVDANYTINYVDGKLTVTPAQLTISADDKTKVYGAALPTLTVTYSGFVNGDTAASLTTQPTLTTSATASSHVSGNPYSITASGAVDADYTISYVAGALAVTPVPLAIAADTKIKAYGAALPGLTASYAGFVNGDTESSLATAPTLSTTATAASHVSGNPYSITVSGAVDADYMISYMAGTLTVMPVALTITADDQTKDYGAALPTLTVSYSGLVNGDTASTFSSAPNTAPTIMTTAHANSHVVGNPYPITASGAVDTDYTISYVAGALTVTPVALIITADNKTKAYGAELPALTASYAGLVNGDTPGSLTTSPALSTTAAASSHVAGSPYAITASGAVDSDYAISYVAGTLTVTPVPLAIAADNTPKAYGAALPSLTASYAGFVNGDTESSLSTAPTLSTTATAASHVSGNPYSITAAGALDADYTISYVAGTLTVTPVGLTITVDDQTKPYGASVPSLTVSYSGLVNGDTPESLTVQPTISTTASRSSHRGTYPITASGAVDPDYTVSYVAGTLTVTQVALIITSDNQTKAYGADLPALTASYAGFTNEDTVASLATAPTLTTTATATSHVAGNPYSITASGAVDSDYAISYVAGTLTVTPVPLAIAADNKIKAYGAALPSLTASYAGFVNGDTESSLSTAPTLSTTATAASHVSGNPYSITAAGALDADYTISYVAGTLTVTPVGLTITADSKTKAYGAALPSLTVTYSGLVSEDTAATFSSSPNTAPAITTTAQASSHVAGNPFSISASGAVDTDYTISYIPGTLTVAPVGLTITADNKTKAYGADLPALTASYAGLVNGDTPGSLTTSPTLSTTATASSHVAGNPYSITASGAVDADYTISYVPGTLIVARVSLSITLDNKTKAYGAALPTLTASYSGFVNGDAPASLTTLPMLSTSATASSHVSASPYAITASGAVDPDYTISYVAGTLTVTSVGLTITADSKTKAYGAALPTLTASYAGFVNGDSSLTTAPTLSTTASAASHVSGSPYSITASGAVDTDYTISYQNGELTVTPVALTITADSKSKAYGAVVPALTVSYSGLVNGDTASTFSAAPNTPPTITTTAHANNHVVGNPYSITASSAVDADYTISYVPGTLTVTPVALIIIADNKAMVLNSAALPALTVTYTGFVNGDSAASLTTQPTISTTATTSSPVGTYPITTSGAVDADYVIANASGTLTIMYANSGTCYGDAGHVILQPINTDNSSVFKQGSTVPAKFRVCDVNGNSIGPLPNGGSIVQTFVLYWVCNGTVSPTNEAIVSTTPDTAFRWDATSKQWIFNISTKNLSANHTYQYIITLNDGSTITFQFGLK